MPVPERRTSRGNTNRRSQSEASDGSLVPIKVGETEIHVPRRFVRAYLSGLLR